MTPNEHDLERAREAFVYKNKSDLPECFRWNQISSNEYENQYGHIVKVVCNG